MTSQRMALAAAQDVNGQDSPTPVTSDATKDVNPSPVGGIPIEPDANEKAWLREVMTIGLMFVMGIFCTILAFLAVWMLQRSVTPANAETQESSSSSGLGDGHE